MCWLRADCHSLLDSYWSRLDNICLVLCSNNIKLMYIQSVLQALQSEFTDLSIELQQPTPSPSSTERPPRKVVSFGENRVIFYEKSSLLSSRSHSAPSERTPYPISEATFCDVTLNGNQLTSRRALSDGCKSIASYLEVTDALHAKAKYCMYM